LFQHGPRKVRNNKTDRLLGNFAFQLLNQLNKNRPQGVGFATRYPKNQATNITVLTSQQPNTASGQRVSLHKELRLTIQFSDVTLGARDYNVNCI
jgi:hypothetical protein